MYNEKSIFTFYTEYKLRNSTHHYWKYFNTLKVSSVHLSKMEICILFCFFITLVTLVYIVFKYKSLIILWGKIAAVCNEASLHQSADRKKLPMNPDNLMKRFKAVSWCLSLKVFLLQSVNTSAPVKLIMWPLTLTGQKTQTPGLLHLTKKIEFFLWIIQYFRIFVSINIIMAEILH